MSDKRAAVAAVGVTKVFQSQGQDSLKALDNVSVTINENEFFTLLGPSGCGKTTLLRLIAGFDFPTEGQILLYGTDIASLPPYKRPVNTVFQNYALFPHMTVAQNIGFGLQMLGRPGAEIEARVAEMLRLVRMEELANRKTSQISGGQQQRVALARALAPQPKVLLLDEPLSALDYKLRKDMQIELKRLQHETGITFIFVTHDQEEALTMSGPHRGDVVKGKILQVGSSVAISTTSRRNGSSPTSSAKPIFLTACHQVSGDGQWQGTRDAQIRRDDRPQTVGRRFSNPKDNATLVVRPEHAEADCKSAKVRPVGDGSKTSSISAPTRIIHVHLDRRFEAIHRAPAEHAQRSELRLRDVATRSASSIGNDAAAQVLRD